MRFRDAVLAALTSVIWWLAFVPTKLWLEAFSAAELTALRFWSRARRHSSLRDPACGRGWSQSALRSLPGNSCCCPAPLKRKCRQASPLWR